MASVVSFWTDPDGGTNAATFENLEDQNGKKNGGTISRKCKIRGPKLYLSLKIK